ncbi:hypothetical protein MSG28_009786 [Choristoneura fumiferana]|uniref:Uncharacterized protein n=1 Tax=Choristoneura fumiferana TaxID=7141 RepID=A0ACC0JCM0_CHOFU|nr:hypothetical protein MSG28_009786 [Choristoneura fumiferana]
MASRYLALAHSVSCGQQQYASMEVWGQEAIYNCNSCACHYCWYKPSLSAVVLPFGRRSHAPEHNAADECDVKGVPSAPQNLTVNRVTSEDIHLSWAPPTTFTHHFIPNPEPKATADNTELQGDEPMKNDLPAIRAETLTNFETIIDSYKKDKLKYNDEFPLPDIMNDYRIRRDLRSHRHRKRRQDVNATDTRTTHAEKHDLETHEAVEFPIEVGVPKIDASTVIGVPSSADVKKMNYFPSDLGMGDYSKATKNLTLLNTAGVLTKVVGFRLRNLKPFTPYKIWVRAFYNFSLQGVKSSDLLDRLGPQSEPLYVLTDVLPPSAPVILNLTCDQPHDILYLQWRQPLEYNNSLDQYVVTLRKLPEQQPRTRLKLPTSKSDIETTISVSVELENVTRYEVKIYAVTLSVARALTLVNGTESPPKEVSSEWCMAHSEARVPSELAPEQAGPSAVLMCVAPVALLACVGAAVLYWRCRSRLSKCISAAYNYLEEGGERAARAPLNAYKKPVVNCSPLRACAEPGSPAAAPEPAARPPRMAGLQHPAVPARDFPRHVAALHADGDIGFSKEYEIVVAKSAALGHTSHHSHRPENRLKNRYLNITASNHSSAGERYGGGRYAPPFVLGLRWPCVCVRRSLVVTRQLCARVT